MVKKIGSPRNPRNNQDTRSNNQAMTNWQIPNNQTCPPCAPFGSWLLEFGICLVLVSWLLVIQSISDFRFMRLGAPRDRFVFSHFEFI